MKNELPADYFKNKEIAHLNKKRGEVLTKIKPIMKAFNIDDYDYIVKFEGQSETLRIYDTYIGCSCNSEWAIINEIIKYLMVVRDICCGAFNIQTRNHLRQYWLDKEKFEKELREQK